MVSKNRYYKRIEFKDYYEIIDARAHDGKYARSSFSNTNHSNHYTTTLHQLDSAADTAEHRLGMSAMDTHGSSHMEN